MKCNVLIGASLLLTAGLARTADEIEAFMADPR